jgi:hypothetical protein
MLIAAHYAFDLALNVLKLFGERHALFVGKVEIGLYFPKVAGIKLRRITQRDRDRRLYLLRHCQLLQGLASTVSARVSARYARASSVESEAAGTLRLPLPPAANFVT